MSHSHGCRSARIRCTICIFFFVYSHQTVKILQNESNTMVLWVTPAPSDDNHFTWKDRSGYPWYNTNKTRCVSMATLRLFVVFGCKYFFLCVPKLTRWHRSPHRLRKWTTCRNLGNTGGERNHDDGLGRAPASLAFTSCLSQIAKLSHTSFLHRIPSLDKIPFAG